MANAEDNESILHARCAAFKLLRPDAIMHDDCYLILLKVGYQFIEWSMIELEILS